MLFTPAAIRSMLDDRGRDPMQVPAGLLAGHTRAQVLVVPMIRFDASGHGWRCSRPARWVSNLMWPVDCRSEHDQLACGTSGCSLLIGQIAQPCTDSAAESWLVQCAQR